jgi:formylmethanofuran dehydrogenase subunit B
MDFRSVACPFCSLHCDDLHLKFDGGHWKLISPNCKLASYRYREWSSVPKRISSSSFQEAAKILKNVHRLLIVLTGDVEQEAVIPAVNLARATSAYLVRDNNSRSENISSAIRAVGLLSATLAELRDRAGQVVILGNDPEKSLPRFWEFLGHKKKEKAILIDSRQILESIQQLCLQERGLKTSFYGDMQVIATRIGKANSGVVFINSESMIADVNGITEIMMWLRELGETKKWYGQILFPSANEFGISQALMSTTGHSGGLSFRKGKIDHDPRSFQLEKLIEYREADAIIIIGEANHLPKPIVKKLEGFNTVVISSEKPHFHTDAWLPYARVGIDSPGTMLRLDGVPVRFESMLQSGQATARDFLVQLANEVKA